MWFVKLLMDKMLNQENEVRNDKKLGVETLLQAENLMATSRTL